MAHSYRGPAVIAYEGAEYAADVDLSIHADYSHRGTLTMKSWDGTLNSDPAIDWFSSATPDEVVLRMPDGREGRFFATAGTLGSGRVEICGTGPAPFGDA